MQGAPKEPNGETPNTLFAGNETTEVSGDRRFLGTRPNPHPSVLETVERHTRAIVRDLYRA
jgi:hypothetical protein